MFLTAFGMNQVIVIFESPLCFLKTDFWSFTRNIYRLFNDKMSFIWQVFISLNCDHCTIACIVYIHYGCCLCQIEVPATKVANLWTNNNLWAMIYLKIIRSKFVQLVWVNSNISDTIRVSRDNTTVKVWIW